MDGGGDFHLGPALEKAHVDDALFALGQAADGFFQCDLIEPMLIGVFGIAHLIHDAQCVAFLAPDRFIE